MIETLQKLKEINAALNRINNDMRREKGLKGHAAIEHYNRWMAAAGMKNLKMKGYGNK